MDDLALNHGGEGELKTQGQRWSVARQVDRGPVVCHVLIRIRMLRSWPNSSQTTSHFHSLWACKTVAVAVGLPDTKNCVIAINATLFVHSSAATSTPLYSDVEEGREAMFQSRRHAEDSGIKFKEGAAASKPPLSFWQIRLRPNLLADDRPEDKLSTNW